MLGSSIACIPDESIMHEHVFRSLFRNLDHWQAWFSFLRCLFGLPTTEADRELFRQCTGRQEPRGPYNEVWLAWSPFPVRCCSAPRTRTANSARCGRHSSATTATTPRLRSCERRFARPTNPPPAYPGDERRELVEASGRLRCDHRFAHWPLRWQGSSVGSSLDTSRSPSQKTRLAHHSSELKVREERRLQFSDVEMLLKCSWRCVRTSGHN